MVFKPMIVDVLEPTFGVFWNFWSKLLAFLNLGEPNVDFPGLLQLNICFLCLLAQNLFFFFSFLVCVLEPNFIFFLCLRKQTLAYLGLFVPFAAKL